MHKTSTSVAHSIGAVFTSLLSCAACPACLPVYAGLLSFLGVELFEISLYFWPLMLGSLGFTISLMAFQAIRRKADLRPLVLALIAASAVVWGAIGGNEYILYLSLATFMGSIFWNKTLLKKSTCSGNCKSHSSHA